MQAHIITLFPDMFQALDYGIVGRAQQNNLLNLQYWNPRDFTTDPHRTVDDRPYGGGPGMVMKVSPLRAAIHAAKAQSDPDSRVIYLSPQGQTLTQPKIAEMALAATPLILLAGRYEGIDQRVIDRDVDEVWSVGDYIVSGGEIPIMLLLDAVTRLLPGALGDSESAEQESFSQSLLEYPHYTRPAEMDGQTVPEILLQGDHQAIKHWRLQQSLKKTWQIRPDLLQRSSFSDYEFEE